MLIKPISSLLANANNIFFKSSLPPIIGFVLSFPNSFSYAIINFKRIASASHHFVLVDPDFAAII